MTDGPGRGLELGVCGLAFYNEFFIFIFNVIGEYYNHTLLVKRQISESESVMKKRLCMHNKYKAFMELAFLIFGHISQCPIKSQFMQNEF